MVQVFKSVQIIMLTGLDTRQVAAALGLREAAVRRRIRKGSLKANKLGPRWQVYLPGKGCRLCETAGVRTVLVLCVSCDHYYCGLHSNSACNAGQHGQSRVVADG